MKIECHFKRKTKKNDYKRYTIEFGINLWYVHTNHGEITWIRHRVYAANMKDVASEMNVTEMPAYFKNAFDIYVKNQSK